MIPNFTRDGVKAALLAVALLGLVSGLGCWLLGLARTADLLWFAGVLPVLAALSVEIARSL